MHAGNLEGCAYHLQVAARGLRRVKDQTTTRNVLEELGTVYWVSSRYVRAFETYVQLADALPGDSVQQAVALYRAGAAAVLCGKKAASQLLRKAIRIVHKLKMGEDPLAAPLYVELGRALHRERCHAEAVDALRHGLALMHEPDPDALNTLALAEAAAAVAVQEREERRRSFNNDAIDTKMSIN